MPPNPMLTRRQPSQHPEHQAVVTHSDSQLDTLIEQFEPILRHINAHRFLWGFSLVCAFVAWNRGLLLLYGLVAFLLAVLLISYVFYFFNLKGVEVTADFAQDEATADTPVAIQTALFSRWRKHFLRIDLPIYRLNHSSGRQQSHYNAEMFVLSHQGTSRYQAAATLPRGVYQLSDATLSSAYPFGLLQAKQNVPLTTKKLYVLPTWFCIERLNIAHANQLQDFHHSSRTQGGHDEFADIRNYRRGDALKTIHWGASARQVSRGKDWMVKTYTNQDLPMALIVLNPFDVAAAQMLGDTVLNNMVSIALSLGEFITRQGYQVQLIGFENVFRHDGNQAFSDIKAWRLALTATMFDTAEPIFTSHNNSSLYRLANHSSDNLRKLAEVEVLDSQQMNLAQGLQHAISLVPQANVLVSFTVNQGLAALPVVANKEMTHITINFTQTAVKKATQSLGNGQRFDIPFSSKPEQLAEFFHG